MAVVPYTGEPVDLANATTDVLARAVVEMREFEARGRDLKAAIGQELVDRTDAAIRAGETTSYTTRLGGYEVQVPSPVAGGDVNADGLRAHLLARVADVLAQSPPVHAAVRNTPAAAAVEGCFKPKTNYTLNRQAYKALAAQFPWLNQALAAHTAPPPRRTPKVKEAGA